MDRAEVLEAILRSKASAPADLSSNADAPATLISTIFVGRWEVVRFLLKAADCPRIGRTLMSFVENPARQDEIHDHLDLPQEPTSKSDINRDDMNDNERTIHVDDDADSGIGERKANDTFLDSLRTQLLRIRIAGLLQHDSVPSKQLVELRTLCHEACAKLEANVFQDIWGVVGRRGKLAYNDQSSPEQDASALAEDAATVSRVQELFEQAEAVVADHSNASKRLVRDSLSTRERHKPQRNSSTVPFISCRERSKKTGHYCCQTPSGHQSHKGHPARVQGDAPTSCFRPSIRNPEDTLPLLALAEALGVAAAVDACLNFIVTEEEAVINATRKQFGSEMDWACIMSRLVKYQREVTPSLQPGPRLAESCVRPAPPHTFESKITYPVKFLEHSGNYDAFLEDSQPSPNEAETWNEMEVDKPCSTAQRQQTRVHCNRQDSWRLGGEEVFNQARGVRLEVHGCGNINGDVGELEKNRIEQSNFEDAYRTWHGTSQVFREQSRQKQMDLPRQQLSTQWLLPPPTSVPPQPPPRFPRVLHRMPAEQVIKEVGRRFVSQEKLPRACTSDFVAAPEDFRRNNRELVPSSPVISSLGSEGINYSTNEGKKDNFSEDGQHYKFTTSNMSQDKPAVSRGSLKETRDCVIQKQRCRRKNTDICFYEEESTEEASTQSSKTNSTQISPIRETSQTGTGCTASSNEDSACQSQQAGFMDDGDTYQYGPAEETVGRPPESTEYVEAFPTGRRLQTENSTTMSAMTASRDEKGSCALARKRALLRVRLARQRFNLEVAVANANERGFRAERRRKREEKLAALLIKTCGSGQVDIGNHRLDFHPSIHGLREINRSGAENSKKCRREEVLPIPNVDSESPLPGDNDGLPSHDSRGHNFRRSSGRRARRPSPPAFTAVKIRGKNTITEHQDEDDEDPRQPLKVVPAEPAAVLRRPHSRRSVDNKSCVPGVGVPSRSEKKATVIPAAQDSISCHSCASLFGPASSSPLIVRLNTFYALPGRHACFGGRLTSGDGRSKQDLSFARNSLYLVLEAGRLRHQSAVQSPASCIERCDCRANTRKQETGENVEGQKRVIDRRRTNIDAGCTDGAWIFRETVVLHLATSKGGYRVLPGDSLRVFVYAKGDRFPDVCRPFSKHRLLEHKSADGPLADDLVGVATLPLIRPVAGKATDRTGTRDCECTFLRPIEVSVVSVEGAAIGFLEVELCGMSRDLSVKKPI